MSDLRHERDDLAARRAVRDEAARLLLVARERLGRLERDARDLERRFDRANRDHARQRDDLLGRISEARDRVSRLRTENDAAAADLIDAHDRFAPLADPRRAISTLSTEFPILLFPVRLETRFVTVGDGTVTQKQLLVRIYPDDCLVDSFEPDLSETEVKNLRRYWCSRFSAGQDEPRERAAWRELCAAHGAGRAVYLVRTYAPLAGTGNAPLRNSSSDVFLVIPLDSPLTVAAEKQAIAAYWVQTWRTGNDETAFTDLRNVVGAARAADVRESLVPFNIDERPQAGADRAAVRVEAVFVVLAAVDTVAVKRDVWTRPPTAWLLPERFVLIGDSGDEHIEILGGMVSQPLAVGPDPLAEGDEQFGEDGGDLHVPDALKWITDFDAALQAGMAFRVDLTPRQAASGFDRLYVIGLRLAADEDAGRAHLETLIDHQFRSQSGLAIVPQGTPTNNTEEGTSGWGGAEQADALFDASRGTAADSFDPNATSEYEKKDGLRLAESLGIDAAVLQNVPAADGTDQAEARAMNAALWPATLGYWMDTQMRPVFDGRAIERTRRHFIDRVSGRGAIPSLRIGRQPYGVLPTTAFSRLSWGNAPEPLHPVGRGHSEFLRVLHEVLTRLDQLFWSGFGGRAPHAGQTAADPQKQLLDIIGLHASSVEFHLQVLDSADRIWNEMQFRVVNRATLEGVMRDDMLTGVDILRAMGYSDREPEIFQKFVSHAEVAANRPVVDAAPLSETEALAAATDDGLNYIEWCRNKAEHAFDDLRQQAGFSEGKLPNALLYHMLRHALQLGYHDAAVSLHVANGLIADDAVAAAYREPAFVHVAGGSERPPSESRYRFLYAKRPEISGDSARTVAQFIPAWLTTAGGGTVLADQLDALRLLEHVPTARLERAFAEHIDLCSYRWDAWMLSLVRERLHGMRRPQGAEGPRRQGVYIGAFGWVENLIPDSAPLLPVQLSGDLERVFADGPPLQRDPGNGGHVLTPSLNHAVSAAVLRNGYLNNASPANPDLFAVNLSSARVRVAIQFLEGIRNGQPLGALLGYQFERRLHDRHAEAETDRFIYEVRRAFPLVAKRINDTVDADAEDAAIENIEARNVCDGLLLLEHVRASATKTYPWDKDLERGSAAQEAIINEEVAALFDIHDAIADVAISEAVHQVATGNADRAAAAMDAFSKGTFPPEPDIVRTPRTGTTITHRVAVHLPIDAVAGAGATPRAETEPALDRWLRDMLPPMADLVVRTRYTNSVGGGPEQVMDVSMQALGLRPIDLLYVIDPESEPAMNDLDDRIAQKVISAKGLCPDAPVKIRYTEPVAGRKTWFETAPLIASLRALVTNSRFLKPSDAALEGEAKGSANAGLDLPVARVNIARSRVDALRADAGALAAGLAPLDDPEAPFGPIVDLVDASISTFVALQRSASLCGVALSSAGLATKAVRDWFILVRRKARETAAFWDTKRSECVAALAEAADPTRPEALKLEAAQRGERAISTHYTAPPPATAALLIPIVTTKLSDFDAVKAQIEAVRTSAATAVKPLWTAWSDTFAPRALHDVTVIDTSDEEQLIRVLVADMRRQLEGLAAELAKRISTADGLIAAAAAISGEGRVAQLADAASTLLGEGFRVVPRFTLSAGQADEWQNAFDGRASLLTHASTLHDFPVDDWLYGVARVRSRMHDLEKIAQVAAAFELPEPVLVPLQFPFRATEPWLALELPAGFDATNAGEHLLYSAIYGSGDFDKAAAGHGGLLLDEWTEAIPGITETAGLAFHYDRPNCEPPHAMLLVTPASAAGEWQWLDLKLAVPETFELAKKRAAEPRNIAGTPLARLLPATLMAFTAGAISISSELHAADAMLAAALPRED